MINTLVPDRICPLSRNPCKAVPAATGMALQGCQIVRFQGDSVFRNANIFGIGAFVLAENLITRLKPRHVRADLLNLAGYIKARDVLFRLEQLERQPCDARRARQQVPVSLIDRGRLDSQENVIIPDDRLIDLLEFENVRRTVFVLSDCLH
jgi:hypothetical protein